MTHSFTVERSSRPGSSPERFARTTAGGGHFDRVSPLRPVYGDGQFGWGAWELVCRFSYSDLDDQGVQGGKFWRITPMVNWHMTDNIRLELTYGYGVLDRFGMEGGTHFLGTRIQFQL